MLNKEFLFLKAHERLILFFGAAATFAALTHWGLSAWERHDQKVYDTKHAVLQADVQASAAQAQRDAALAQQYQRLATQVLAQNAALEQAIAARDVATRKQQAADQTLPPSDLAARWEQLDNLPPGSVTWTGVLFTVTPAAAVKTVQAAEDVPRLRQDLTDTQTELTGERQRAEKQGELVAGLQAEVTSLHKQLTDLAAADRAEINLVRAKARKSKVKVFLTGYVLGLLTRPIARGLGY